MTAGKLLKALRKELGWTQKAMAKRLGISPPTLSRIEKGKLEPSLEAFRRAAGILVNLDTTSERRRLGSQYFIFIFGD